MVPPAPIPGGDVHAKRRGHLRKGRTNSAKSNDSELSPLELPISHGLPLAGPNAAVHSCDVACCRGLWCKRFEVEPSRRREVSLDHAARTAFQILGAVLPLVPSLPSLN